ncbi:MAG: RND transporter [Planctomycetota bacterium]
MEPKEKPDMRMIATTLTGSALALALLLLIGCGAKPAPGSNDNSASDNKAATANDASEWWCIEHAVPEHLCGVCNAAYGAECKKKSDWCEEHGMPDSQCFAHHPELQEKFAMMYRNRYGAEPPAVQKEDDEHHDDHDH